MADINLLPEEEIREVEVKRTRRRVTTYSLATLAGVAVVTVVVFGYYFFLVQQDRQLNKKIGSLSTQVSELRNVESLARLLKNKLTAILQVSKESQNFENILTDVSQVIPQGVALSDLSISEANLVTLTGSAVSASEFSNLVNSILSKNNPATPFTSATVESLTRDDQGVYQFAISGKLKEQLTQGVR